MLRDYKSSPPRLVIVEKDPDFSEFLQETFIESGYKVQCFATYDKALQWIVNRPADIVTTNIQKEVPEGYHFIRNIRKCPKRDIPIIVITGSVDKDLIVKLAPLKVNKILVKPVNILSVIQCAGEILDFNNQDHPPSTGTPEPPPETKDQEQKSQEDEDSFELTDEAV